MSVVTTLILVLTVGAPEAPAADAPAGSARTTIQEAIDAVDSRLALLKALRERSAAGDRISLDAVQSAVGTPSDPVETLDSERRTIEDLRDAIRIAEADRRRAAEKEKARAAARRNPEQALPEQPVRPAPEVKKPGETPGPEAGPGSIPKDPVLRRRLATVRYRDGDFANALRLYSAIAKVGDDTWIRLRLARCLEKLGHTDEARTAYEALIREHPDDPWAKAARWSLSILDLDPGNEKREGGDR